MKNKRSLKNLLVFGVIFFELAILDLICAVFTHPFNWMLGAVLPLLFIFLGAMNLRTVIQRKRDLKSEC